VIQACVAGLIHEKDRFRATAVIADVTILDSDQDAIAVDLEHTDGFALTVHLPYKKGRFFRIHYGELRVSSGTRRVWVGS
jgi:hypothetical protein